MWTTSGRIESSQEAVGIANRASGPIIFILLLLIGPVGIWYAQSELNRVWAAQGTGALPGPAPAQAGPEVPAQAPQQTPPQGPQAPPPH